MTEGILNAIESFHVTSRRPQNYGKCLWCMYESKLRNGGHVGIPTNPLGIELHSHANTFSFFQFVLVENMLIHHVSENSLQSLYAVRCGPLLSVIT